MKKVVLLTILVFSLVATGCINQKSDGGSQMSDVGNQISENKNQNGEMQATETSAAENIQDIENWRIYEKKDQNVRIKYHKNWYYDRDEQAEKELGYDLHIGFAESPEILAQNTWFHPIDFIIADKDVEWKYSGYFKKVAEKDGKQYILRTGNDDVNGDILDKMAESFEFLDEINITKDWQVYQNKEFGIKFKYPPVFTAPVYEKSDVIHFVLAENIEVKENVHSHFYIDKDNVNIDSIINERGRKILKEEIIKDQKSKRGIFPPIPERDFYLNFFIIEHPSKEHIIEFRISVPKFADKYFDKIIDSIEFINN